MVACTWELGRVVVTVKWVLIQNFPMDYNHTWNDDEFCRKISEEALLPCGMCASPGTWHRTAYPPCALDLKLIAISIHQVATIVGTSSGVVGWCACESEKRRRVRKKLWSVHCPCILGCLPACLRTSGSRVGPSDIHPHVRLPLSVNERFSQKTSRRGSTSVVTCDLQLEPSERDLVRILLQAE